MSPRCGARVPSARGDQGEGRGEVGVLEDLALGGRATARCEGGLEGTGFRGEQLHAEGPLVGDHFAHGKAFARVENGRSEQPRHREVTEFPVELEPAIDGARDGDREQAARWDRGAFKSVEVGFQLVVAKAARGTA